MAKESTSQGKQNGGAKRAGSLARRLGRIPVPLRTSKPRPPKVEKPQTAAPRRPGAATPRLAVPNKPGRSATPHRVMASPPLAARPVGSVAGRLGRMRGT